MQKEEKQQESRLMEKNFIDLNLFRGIGEDPVYHRPILVDRPRFWPLDQWKGAPKDLGYDEFPSYSWKNIQLLKYPITQSVYQDILWEIRPKTIFELGVFSGGSLVWFKDLASIFGFSCQVIGIDKDLSRCQIPEHEMENISLYEADCNIPETLRLPKELEHPILFIDDAHCNTFNVLRWAVNNLLMPGDYVIIEDMMPYWRKYSPRHLEEYLADFSDFFVMDLVYSNTCPQLEQGVFKVTKSNK